MSYLIWTIAIDRALILLGLSNFLNKTNSTSSNRIGYFKCVYTHAPPSCQGNLQSFIQEGSATRSSSLPFCIPVRQKMYPLFSRKLSLLHVLHF